MTTLDALSGVQYGRMRAPTDRSSRSCSAACLGVGATALAQGGGSDELVRSTCSAAACNGTRVTVRIDAGVRIRS